MATLFSHAAAAWAIGKVTAGRKPAARLLVAGMVCACIPDLDAIGFWLGVPYHSVWGHRGITHSLFFAAVLAGVAMKTVFPGDASGSAAYRTQFLFLFLATASHPVLDAMTNGGLGVAFFAPFDNSRYFFPFRPIRVSPISVTRIFSDYGWQVFKSELIWIWIPSAAAVATAALVRARK